MIVDFQYTAEPALTVRQVRELLADAPADAVVQMRTPNDVPGTEWPTTYDDFIVTDIEVGPITVAEPNQYGTDQAVTLNGDWAAGTYYREEDR